MPETPRRTDLFITTAFDPSMALVARAQAVAEELNAPFVPRRNLGMPAHFTARPDAERGLIVQTERLLLVDRDGHQFFYHPNMAFLRLVNVRRGARDLLVEAAQLGPGDSVLDATLGYAAEAILCAHVVGETGTVHGIEAVPELGLVVREGLQTVVTDTPVLNAAMRRVRVVHLGDHLEYLRACPDGSYDVVCFDPFFEEEMPGSEQFAPIRFFGTHTPLLPEAVEEARRVARRRVLIKSARRVAAEALARYGVTEIVQSRHGKVAYGVLPPHD